MSDAKGLQLLPSQKKSTSLPLEGRSGMLMAALALLVVLGIAYGVATAMRSRTLAQVAQADADIAAIYQKRDKAAEEKLLDAQRQLATARSLLKSRTSWSADFAGMQRLIEPGMQFVSLQADADTRSYRFHALADSYSTVARQIAALYGSLLVKDVRVNTITIAPAGRVDVTMEIILARHE